MKKARKGQREGMAFFMSLGSCLLSGRQTIVDHFRLRWVQACGEKSQAHTMNNFFNRKAPDSPSPFGKRQDP